MKMKMKNVFLILLTAIIGLTNSSCNSDFQEENYIVKTQKITQEGFNPEEFFYNIEMEPEEFRIKLAELMISFKESVSEYYEEGDSYENFCYKLQYSLNDNDDFTEISEIGHQLLSKTYQYIENNISDDEILENYEGEEMLTWMVFYSETLDTDGSEFFGGSGHININKAAWPCKWYQLRCHVQNIFGESANQVLSATQVIAKEVLPDGWKEAVVTFLELLKKK